VDIQRRSGFPIVTVDPRNTPHNQTVLAPAAGTEDDGVRDSGLAEATVHRGRNTDGLGDRLDIHCRKWRCTSNGGFRIGSGPPQ